MPPSFRLRPAAADDLPAVRDLLARAGLPDAGIGDHLGTLLVARSGGAVVGCAAVEVHVDGALLRSVAVDAAWRGRGLGGALTDAALRLAAARGAERVFLLTTTADDYFPRFGFAPATRADVPPGVQTSAEFRGACPASARVMERRDGKKAE